MFAGQDVEFRATPLATRITIASHFPVHAQSCKDVWIDVRKPWRGNAGLDAAVQARGFGRLVPVEL
jgi:hypothetical protein